MPRAWSCDEPTDGRDCRNPHGCHCAEIASLLHRLEGAKRSGDSALPNGASPADRPAKPRETLEKDQRIKELEEALEKIATGTEDLIAPYRALGLDQVRRIARQALSTSRGEKDSSRTNLGYDAPDGAASAGSEGSGLKRLAELSAILPPAPWTLWTACSFSRITGPDGKEGGVLHAYNQRSGGHPDLSMPEDQLFALVEMRNLVAALCAEAASPEGLGVSQEDPKPIPRPDSKALPVGRGSGEPARPRPVQRDRRLQPRS